MGFGYGFGISIFEIIFPLVFIAIFAMVIVTFAKELFQWNKNNHSPRLIVDATIVAKRQHTSHHHNNTGEHMHTSSTTYYVTFQVESGDRMELLVPRTEYGMLAEGDQGILTFQGTRYIGFERKFVTI